MSTALRSLTISRLFSGFCVHCVSTRNLIICTRLNIDVVNERTEKRAHPPRAAGRGAIYLTVNRNAATVLWL